MATAAAVVAPPPLSSAAAVTAIVTEVSGQAWVRPPDGSLRELRPGSVIPPASEVITASGATVTLTIDGAAPITIGENRSVAITDDLVTSAEPFDAAVTPPDTLDSERLLAALESGEDPFGILEATAAIAAGPGGDDGGSNFVRLLRILETTTPLDLAYPRPGRVEEELPRLEPVAKHPFPALNLLSPSSACHSIGSMCRANRSAKRILGVLNRPYQQRPSQ